jgi:predicted ATP-grasp superfamily ATP-dependent carboligase
MRRPRVIVTGAEQRAILAACRGLAAAGYHVSTVAEKRFAPAHWSRFSKEQITLAGPETDPEGYVERLSPVLRRGKYDLVMPGTEQALLPISERRGLIEPYARLALPPHELVLRALNKPLLNSQAAAVGLAPPRSTVCSSHEEALAAMREFDFPLLVKPSRSVGWTGGRMRRRTAQFVEDLTHFEASVEAVGVPLTLQEYVPGATIVSCAAVRVDGQLHGLTFARYARTYPSQVGEAAMATTIAPPQPLTHQVEELLGLIGWHGIFELELLKLGEDRFGAIDFNPRPFGWMTLAIGAGANLPAIWADHVLGRHSVSLGRARVGVRYRWEEAEILNALAQLRRGCLRSAGAVLRPHRGIVHGYFRVDDPGPLAARMLFLARKAATPQTRYEADKRVSC